MEIDKSSFKDDVGRMRTQGLFLEIIYTPEATFTLKDDDHFHEGKLYISLKKRYLEMEDPTEYEFANKWLLGWKHWQRINESRAVAPHIAEWREELEFKLKAKAAKEMATLAKEGNFQAIKWFVDKGWAVRPPGRPTKAEKEKTVALDNRLADEYGADVHRLFANQGK